MHLLFRLRLVREPRFPRSASGLRGPRPPPAAWRRRSNVGEPRLRDEYARRVLRRQRRGAPARQRLALRSRLQRAVPRPLARRGEARRRVARPDQRRRPRAHAARGRRCAAPAKMTGVSFLPLLKGEPFTAAQTSLHRARPARQRARDREHEEQRLRPFPRRAQRPLQVHLQLHAVDSLFARGFRQRGRLEANDQPPAPNGTLAPGLVATYFTTPRPVYELYDLETDPSELTQPQRPARTRGHRARTAPGAGGEDDSRFRLPSAARHSRRRRHGDAPPPRSATLPATAPRSLRRRMRTRTAS